MKVLILAGGKGTRLGLTDRPKPMVLLSGVPVLERLTRLCVAAGFTDLMFLNGHLAEVIEAHFGDGSRFGAHIEHVREPVPAGTAGAVRDVRDRLGAEPFLVLYGDIFSDVDLQHFAAFAKARGGLGSVFVHPNDHPYDSDLVEVGAGDRIARFIPKPHPDGEVLPNLVSGALYVLDPKALDFAPTSGPADFGRETLPAIVDHGGDLYAYRSLEYSKDIGTPERLLKVERDLASGRVARMSRRTPKPAIFFDRDGVLNHDEADGVHRAQDLEAMDGAGAALRRVNHAGFPAICVTNQPDLAKGKFTPKDLAGVFAALDTALAAEGGFLDDVFWCPHHPEGGWPGEIAALKVVCDCRKPKPGLMLQAAEKHNLDLAASWVIGDRYRDLAAGRAVGAKGVLVLTGEAGSDRGKFDFEADYVAPDVGAAVDYILERLR